jgi:sugar phosphate isomerase/epimerase
MKKTILVCSILVFNIILTKITAQNNQLIADSSDWKLCAQAWTFHKFNFATALDKIKEAGIQYVEMFPGQEIGAGIPGYTNFSMDKETREKVLVLIRSKGLKLINYGVTSGKTQEEWKQLFEFAKAMGIKTIITEADSMQLNYIEPMCANYDIYIALHNHPNPSHYWDPDYTMNQIKNRSQYIGICADLGHWIRSGLNSQVSLKKCEGRIRDVHAKDLIPAVGAFNGYHDIPWGTGISNFPGMMRELDRQGYKGTITIEYEYNWNNSLPEVKESVDYFYRLSRWIKKD